MTGWTGIGTDTAPRGTRNPFTLANLTLGAPAAESIAAASAAGFRAVGIRVAPRRPQEAFERILGNTQTVRALRRQAVDAGIVISNVQAYQFFPDTRWEGVKPVVAAAHDLGAAAIVAYSFDPDEARFLDLFARYCDEARAAGIRIALEFMPYCAVRDLASALAILDRSGASNAGVVIDMLHFVRSGGHPRDLRSVDPSRIAYAQLCDARTVERPATDAELITEARTARVPAGQGVLPLFEFLDALPPQLEIEYEVAPAERAAMSAHEKAQAARADADRFLEAYRSHRATLGAS